MRVGAAWAHVLGLFVLTVVGLLVMSLPVQAGPRTGLEPGGLVVADQDLGQVLRVASEGAPEVMASGLIFFAVVLAGVALVGGAQLVRNRGDDDSESDVGAKAAKKAGGAAPEGVVADDDGATETAGAWTTVAPERAQTHEAAATGRPGLSPPDLGRLPLFAVPAPQSPTAGPFLSSLFAEGAIAEPEPPPATSRVTVPPTPHGGPAPPGPAAEPPAEAVSEQSVQNDLVEMVGRPGPVIRRLGGRRRARRRRRAAERRHDHLRALGQLNVMPLPPPPEVIGPSSSGGESELGASSDGESTRS